MRVLGNSYSLLNYNSMFITLSKYKYSPTELTDSSVNSLQLTQKYYDGWKLAGHLYRPYKRELGDLSTCGDWKNYGCLKIWLHNENGNRKALKIEKRILPYKPKQSKIDRFYSQDNPIFTKPTKLNCGRLGCPECLQGTCFRKALKIEKRILSYKPKQSKIDRFLTANLDFKSNDNMVKSQVFVTRKPIHVIVSPDLEFLDMTFQEVRKKVVKLLLRVGMEGGVLVAHHFRKDEEGLYKKRGLHFHCIGYAENNRVNGEEVAKQFQENRIIVKNVKERMSVRRTASYLLSHCSVNENRTHSVTWFGKLSYNKMKVESDLTELEKLEKLKKCPLCDSKLVEIFYIGKGHQPTTIKFDKGYNWTTIKNRSNLWRLEKIRLQEHE